MGLEHKISNNIGEKIKYGLLSRIKNSLVGKIATYSLATALTFGGVYALSGCNSEGGKNGGNEVSQLVDNDVDGYKSDVDCNDNNNKIYPNAPEICDLIDNQCPGDVGYGIIDEGVQNTYYKDNDGDGFGDPSNTIQACSAPLGYVTNNVDCNDNDANINPDRTEITYNGLDDDCNSGTLDDDLDKDGYFTLTGTVDCNDNDNAIYPNAPEICDRMDNNCDGIVDEGVQNTYYKDNDGDGYGDSLDSILACSAPLGYVTNNTDCNDNNLSINPGEPETIYNGIDDDCNSSTLDDDMDQDGYFVLTGSIDCNDNNNKIYPNAPELFCDGIDNQCPGDSGYGIIDEGCLTNKIAFKSKRDGNYEIYKMNADSSEQTKLTNVGVLTKVGVGTEYSAWSPDGNKIAFNSSGEATVDIYLINADGSNQVNLTNTGLGELRPSWSPDGSKIAFESYRNDYYAGEIYVMNADGSEQTRLTNSILLKDHSPAWSPDGNKIAFNSDLYEISIMNADGNGQTVLTGNYDFFPTWSPDGSRIAFYSNRDGNYEIYVMNNDGSNQVNLTNNPASEYSPNSHSPCRLTWSPDGSRIAFYSNRDGNYEIYVMNNDGSGQTRLTNNILNDYCPAWSPVGSKIVFYSEIMEGSYAAKWQSREIYVINADGTGLTRLTNNTVRDDSPSWSPK